MLEAAAKLAESDELKPKPRAALREVAANFERWQKALETTPHTELAETILEESGYTDMWKNDRSAEAPGRLENLKELIRSMEEYESLAPSSNMSRWSWTPSRMPSSTPSTS
ncbi:hypothetical protein AJ88_16620 [Mesorhizobium amorphae CCBAU 01583]|nr:hypothetical protein AJ88_16620 [Mesorhizobium amorphae CCBAU 01583]